MSVLKTFFQLIFFQKLFLYACEIELQLVEMDITPLKTPEQW